MKVSEFHSCLSATPCPTVGWAFVSVAIFQLPSDWPHDFHCCSLLLFGKREERGVFNQIFKEQVSRSFQLQQQITNENEEVKSFSRLFITSCPPFCFLLFQLFFRPTQKAYKFIRQSQKTFAKKNVLLGKCCISALKRAMVGAYMQKNDNCP